MAVKERSLVYRRAGWLRDLPLGATFEGCLREVLNRRPNIADNRVTREDGVTAEVRHYDVNQRKGVYLHVVAYTPREDISVVPIAERVPQADLDIAPAPDGTEFMDGDLTLRATGDHVVLCPSGLREGFVAYYLRLLFRQAGMDGWTGNFDLLKVANVNKAQQIANEGVKAVKLDVGLYDETGEEIRRTISRSLNDKVREWILLMFAEDPDLEQLRHEENLNARLVITFDGRKSGGELGQRRLIELSTRLFDEESGGYAIETRAGTTIRADELTLRKRVTFDAFGKTIHHDHAWDEIDQYFGELYESRALEH